MPQLCGVNSLYPSNSLVPSNTLAPGSGKIFIPTLPLNPADFPIDDSAAVMVASSDVVSLGRFYPARLFNDLPQYFQGLPYERVLSAPSLPEFEGDSDNPDAKWWGIQRIILRAVGRELARVDYILRGRVSLSDYQANRRLPHATPPDDLNQFELDVDPSDSTLIRADASFINPSSVRFPVRVENVLGDTMSASTVVTNLASTEGMYPGLEVSGAALQGSTSGDMAASSPVIQNIPSTVGYVVGAFVSGAGIPSGAKILSVDGPTQITLTRAATQNVVGAQISVGIRTVIVSVDSPTQVTLNLAAVATASNSTLIFKYRGTERYHTNTEPAYALGSGPPGLRYIFAKCINEQQTVQVLGASGGTFTLSYGLEETSAIPFNAAASVVQTALEQLVAFQPGDILVNDLGTGYWSFDFASSYRGTDTWQLSSDGSNLLGAAEIIHSTVVEGNSGFSLSAGFSSTPPTGNHLLIGDASWDGSSWTAVSTYSSNVGTIPDGVAYYDPFLDPKGNNEINPACAPLSQNEGLAPQLFAATANWALDLWERMLGLEVPSKNAIPLVQYPERRSRVFRALLGSRASTAAEFSYLATARARELGITIGGFEESQYTDPGWDDSDFKVAALNEVAYLTVNNASGGNFKLSADNGLTYTGPIDYDASAATVESALLALSQFDVGDVTVSKTGSTYYFTYGGQYTGVNMPPFLVDDDSLVGLSPFYDVTIVREGSAPATDEIQRLDLSNVSGGTFTLSIYGQETEPLSYASSDKEVQSSLSYPESINVDAIPGNSYTFTFVNRLGAKDVPVLVVNGRNLTGISASCSQGVASVDITSYPPMLWRGYQAISSQPNYALNGSPEESTYPYWIWCTVYGIEGLNEDPAGAAARVNTLRQYIKSMTPAHIQCGFDWGPIGGFITGISLVGVDRV